MIPSGSFSYQIKSILPRRKWGIILRATAFALFMLLGISLASDAEDTGPVKTVILVSDGQTRQVLTKKQTVQTLLHQELISLGKHDRCEPQISTPVVDGMQVVVTRVSCEFVSRNIDIPIPTVTRWDDRLDNEPVVLKEGKIGLAKETTVIWKKNGVVSVQWVQPLRTVREASPKVIIRGTMPSRSGKRVRKVLMMESTAYDPGPQSCGPYANGYTATGMKAGRGVVAVDPRVIPLGTKVYVDGYGPAIAADTGGAIKGNRLDVCYPTRKEALNWGRRQVMVLIYE